MLDRSRAERLVDRLEAARPVQSHARENRRRDVDLGVGDSFPGERFTDCLRRFAVIFRAPEETGDFGVEREEPCVVVDAPASGFECLEVGKGMSGATSQSLENLGWKASLEVKVAVGQKEGFVIGDR